MKTHNIHQIFNTRVYRKSRGKSSKYGYTANPCRILSVDETRSYLKEMIKISLIRAIGVFLCITCVIGYIFFGSIQNNVIFFEKFFDVIGTLVFWRALSYAACSL